MSQEVTGYDPDVRLYASRYRQGQRTVYALDMSLTQIASLLPKPDPSNPTEGNRRIKESHALAFGQYVRENAEWVAPALVLRAPDIFQFEVKESIGGTEFGVISFPQLARDGPEGPRWTTPHSRDSSRDPGHRQRAGEERGAMAASRRNDALPAVMVTHESTISKLTEQRERFARDRPRYRYSSRTTRPPTSRCSSISPTTRSGSPRPCAGAVRQSQGREPKPRGCNEARAPEGPGRSGAGSDGPEQPEPDGR